MKERRKDRTRDKEKGGVKSRNTGKGRRCAGENRKLYPYGTVKGPREKNPCLGWAGDILPDGASHSPNAVVHQDPASR